MNLAEELALVAIDPSSGRHALGLRSELNACLAGLLITELLLDGVVEVRDKGDRVVVTGKAEPKSPILAAATAVVIERGPKIKAVLSHMNKGLSHRLGLGTWDAVVNELGRCRRAGRNAWCRPPAQRRGATLRARRHRCGATRCCGW